MFKTSNLGKPASKKWKYVSKFLSRSLPLYIGAIIAVPDKNINADIKVWIVLALSIAVATVSGLSEFTTDEQN